MMSSHELIQRYLLGVCSEQEVSELERRLGADEELQDSFLREAEIDAHLRQEAQLAVVNPSPVVQTRTQSGKLWKWVSGVSTLAASILLAIVLFGFPPKTALAFPSLGNIVAHLSLADSIWLAAGTGNREMLTAELRKGVLVDAKLNNELTPLHVAALFGQAEATGWLLDEKANVNIANTEGNTALHMAAFLGNTDIVQQLLESGADPSRRNKLGFNSIDLVASAWNTEQEEYLNELADRLQTEFDLERIRNERAVVLKLLVNAGDSGVGTAPGISIFEAVLVGNQRAVEQHILAGTDLNQKESFGGSTPLMLAATFGKAEIAKLLIDASVDLDLQNSSGGTALHQACFFCRPDILEMLIQAGADLTKTNARDLTPQDAATMELDDNMVAAYQTAYELLGLELALNEIAKGRAEILRVLNKNRGTGPTQ